MNKFTNKIKDLFYDTTDYAIILLVVVVVALIIGWRLDILFDENIDKEAAPKETIETPAEETKPKEDLIEKEKQQQKGINEVVIPEGSTPDSIAILLQEKGIIANKFQFLKRSDEMGATSKLSPGKYKFSKDTTLEDVIKEISNK